MQTRCVSLKNRLCRTICAALAALSAAAALSSCGGGVRGIDPIDWTKYDELVAAARAETATHERENLLHEAEDMLMSTSCVVPLYDYRDAYLQKSTLTGVYQTHYGAKSFVYASTASEDNVVTAYLGDVADSFDPALASTSEALTVVANTFAGLFRFDADGSIVNALCESYDISDDALVYTFKIRFGLVWSDGSALGASDFVYSWRRAADPSTNSPYRELFDIIARDEDSGKLMLEADETDMVLTVTLSAPCDYFIELCAFSAFYPVNESCVEGADGYMDIYGNIIDPDAWTNKMSYVVSGAFVYTGISEGKYIYRKNDRFYDNANVSLSSLEFLFSSDSGGEYARYATGELDYLGVVPSANHTELAGTSEYHSDDVCGVYYLAFDFNSSVFSGMEAERAAQLRRAVSLYIDREYIVKNITANGEGAATSAVPYSTLGGMYRRDTKTHKYPFPDGGYYSASTEENRAEAQKIIKSLGMDEDGDGKLDPAYRFTLSYLTKDTTRDIAIAQSIQQDLSELGIMVKVTAAKDRVFDFESGIYNYDVIAEGCISYYDDAHSMLERWTTGALGNRSRLGSLLVEEDKNAY